MTRFFIRLQPASRKELRRIALGTLVLDLGLIGVLFLASLFGVGTFDLSKILRSILIGSAIAILNFSILCLTVQSAFHTEDQKKRKASFQLSYHARMILQAAWAVAAFLLPGFHFIAGVSPILFPKVIIFYLHSKRSGRHFHGTVH